MRATIPKLVEALLNLGQISALDQSLSNEAMAGWNACECLLDVGFAVIDAYPKAVLMIENSVITLTLCWRCESISEIELTL